MLLFNGMSYLKSAQGASVINNRTEQGAPSGRSEIIYTELPLQDK